MPTLRVSKETMKLLHWLRAYFEIDEEKRYSLDRVIYKVIMAFRETRVVPLPEGGLPEGRYRAVIEKVGTKQRPRT